MNREVLGKCPVCGGDTSITKIRCSKCKTTIEGDFNLCKFCRLTPEQKEFIDVFIKCRGNIKEIEKELGISYPTVKNKIEDVVMALGHKVDDRVYESIDRKEILDRLNNGEISVDEALELLKQ
ncbi:MAG TPA: DUF2089 domain-containing protein [Acetivibrio saccincola]|uniref:DUF2089 domain-containing protein n=1 Tax=Acetivibrio saccincola TaxID=1677857 RepID=UPI002C82D1DF|nr:DUF2089 domain-containing protein [Acetivibrio saccincola]HOA98179.1 DUF2089 domain-containing protein [Acetivibrio saccincola]HQD28236.1 DUF2089 domain-containing protein [Acetivibrio saccincola]